MHEFTTNYREIRLRAYNASKYLHILLQKYEIKDYVVKNLLDEIETIKYLASNGIREEELD
jgi:hypothetical protein